jgi:aldose 1-epimerase
MRFAAFLLALSTLPAAAQYSVRRIGEVVQLVDAAAQTTVSVLTSVGNLAFEMKVKGQNVIHFPYASVEEFKKNPGLNGIPFLGPWANRLDEQAFYANGKKYILNMELGNVRGRTPMHGFLLFNSEWRVVEARSDTKSAWVTSRLEFYRQPAWMAQWPFAHTIEMTYRLQGGVLEVQARIENLSAEPMPMVIGFHPYFQLTDSPRDEWTAAVGARTEWLLSPAKIPTG